MSSRYRASPQATVSGKVGGEPRVVTCSPQEVADEGHAHRAERPEVQVVAAAVVCRSRVRSEAGCRRRQGRDRLVEVARRLQPPDEVAATQPAGRPRGLPAREDDVAAGFLQLLRQLAARLPAADDQDWPRWQAGRVSVVLDIDLQEASRQ